MEEFPAYAPELCPAEYVWAQADRALANSAPTDLAQLNGLLRYAVRRIRRSPPLLWSCIHAIRQRLHFSSIPVSMRRATSCPQKQRTCSGVQVSFVIA